MKMKRLHLLYIYSGEAELFILQVLFSRYSVQMYQAGKGDMLQEENWGKSFNTVVYDWRNHSYAKQQCRTYLSTLKQFDILSDEVFEKSYPLIALIPTYNEAERITECLRSIEKYCDGIILLDIASFFKAEWFIFIDADERFDDRFVDLREVMKKPDVDTVGIWIANVWDSREMYRTDMKDSHPLSQNGLWFRWRMFRNKGRMQISIGGRLHFKTIPYFNKRVMFSHTLLLHVGYLDEKYRMWKYAFYLQEDKDMLFFYKDILVKSVHMKRIENITSAFFDIKKKYDIGRI